MVEKCTDSKVYIFFCIYKMFLISVERYKNAEVDFLKIRKKTDEIWVSMKYLHDDSDS